MSDPIKTTRSFRDQCSIKITRAKLYWDVGRQSISPKRDVPYTNGTKWWLSMYPNGELTIHEDYISVCFNVTDPVNVHLTFTIDGTDVKKVICHPFVRSPIRIPRFAFHNDILPDLCGKSLTVTCAVKFDIDLRPKYLKSSLFHSCDHVPTDFEFVVGDATVKAHRHLLALISPVFHAVFSHDTVEARTGQLIVKDFEFNVVKAAIDFCYGRELDDNSAETIVGVLRFGDKYDIKSINIELEKTLLFNLNFLSFCSIAHYAVDCSKPDIMNECAKFFKEYIDIIKETDKFKKLPSSVAFVLLKDAFSLPDNVVLAYANSFGITSVTDHFEQDWIGKLNIDNFAVITNYAWSLSREVMKRKCAQFFNDHRLEITTMDSFLSMEPTTAMGVMNMAAEIGTSA